MPIAAPTVRALVALAAAACVALPCAPSRANEVGVDVFGLSYHFDRNEAQALGVDNSVNPGLGFRYRFAEWSRWTFDAQAGVFRDSGRNTAVYGGVSALWNVAGGLQVGGALAVLNSRTYNDGDAFITVLPLAAYDFGPVTLNVTFFPKIARYNDVATLGFWITLWPGRW